MKVLLILGLVLTGSAWGQARDEVGEVTRVSGSGAVLVRAGGRSPLAEGQPLELHDVIRTDKGVAQILLNPGTQVNIAQNSSLEISEQVITNSESNETEVKSVIHFIQGQLRLLVEKLGTKVDQRVEKDNVAFAVRGTEFEVEDGDEGMDLQVFEGQVEVLDQSQSASIGTVARDESITVLPMRGGKRQWRARSFKRRQRLLEFASAGQLSGKWEKRLQKWRERQGVRASRRLERKALREERVDQRNERRRARRN